MESDGAVAVKFEARHSKVLVYRACSQILGTCTVERGDG